MKLPTIKLQEMLAKSIKGASFNKLMPMTSMIAIKVKNKELTLTTTDGTNYLYMIEPVDADDFYVVVNADVFAKLIAKTTAEEIELELTKDYLTVNGNGTYKIALELDADGTPAILPDPLDNIQLDNKQTISLSVVNTIINTAKASLMEDNMNVPCYTGYYMGDKIIATDATQICGIDIKMFNEDMLISPITMDLVGLADKESIDVYVADDNKIVFKTDNCIVYGRTMTYLKDFDVKSINSLIVGKFNTMCKVSKLDFLSVLDRMALFVSKYEKNQIRLTFTKDGIEVSSQSSNAIELIKYRFVNEFDDYTCVINILMLQAQLKAYASDEVELWYKNEANNAIKLVDGNITQLIALCDDER